MGSAGGSGGVAPAPATSGDRSERVAPGQSGAQPCGGWASTGKPAPPVPPLLPERFGPSRPHIATIRPTPATIPARIGWVARTGSSADDLEPPGRPPTSGTGGERRDLVVVLCDVMRAFGRGGWARYIQESAPRSGSACMPVQWDPSHLTSRRRADSRKPVGDSCGQVPASESMARRDPQKGMVRVVREDGPGEVVQAVLRPALGSRRDSPGRRGAAEGRIPSCCRLPGRGRRNPGEAAAPRGARELFTADSRQSFPAPCRAATPLGEGLARSGIASS